MAETRVAGRCGIPRAYRRREAAASCIQGDPGGYLNRDARRDVARARRLNFSWPLTKKKAKRACSAVTAAGVADQEQEPRRLDRACRISNGSFEEISGFK